MKSLADCRLYGILDLGYVAASAVPDIARRMVAGRRRCPPASRQAGAGGRHRCAGRASPSSHRPKPGVPLIINDHPFLVESTRADGAHIGQDDGPLATARALAGPGAIVGRSTHSVEQALAARDEGADYLGFGPLFATPTKPDYAPIGLDDIARVHAEITDRPVFCIGGVKLENLSAIIAAGARRVGHRLRPPASRRR